MTTSADPSAPRDAREAFIGLVRWISRSQSSEGEPQSEATISNSPLPLVELAGDAACCSTRGLAAKKEISPSCVIIRLPWSCAITPTSVLRSPSLKCLLPGRRLLALRDLLKNPDSSLLPHPWSLLLALGLLCEFADPRAPRRLYASLLPTPPGTPVSAAAPLGPAATDILLFTPRELEALRCEPLARAARKERRRLEALHGVLFGSSSSSSSSSSGGRRKASSANGGEEEEGEEDSPSISLGSFLWAHALVRSRALDLRVVSGAGEGTGGGKGEVCLLPLIDLAQHGDGKSGGSAPATLRLVNSSSSSSSTPSSPAAVELVAGASSPIPKGAPVCLDYGSRPLRDLLRGYAFVPKVPSPDAEGGGSSAAAAAAAAVSEIFEDFSGASLANRAALVVDASCGFHSLPKSLLRLASVRLLAAPGGDDQALEFGSARVVFVVVGGNGSTSSSNASSPVIFTATEEEEELPMRPEAEVGVCRWVAGECEQLASEIEGWGEEEEMKKEEGEERGGGGGEDDEKACSSWLSREASSLASDYRAARVALLRVCSESLEAQAWLVESCLGAAVN